MLKRRLTTTSIRSKQSTTSETDPNYQIWLDRVLAANRKAARWDGLRWVSALTVFVLLDWADDIFNTLGVPNVPGIGFVKNAIRFVGNLILAIVHLGISILKPIIQDAWQVIGHAADLAARGLYGLALKVEHGIAGLAEKAYGWVVGAIHYAEGLVSQAIRDLQHWAADAIHFVSGIVDALNRDIIQPLWHFAHSAYDFLTTQLLPDLVNGFRAIVHDVTQTVESIAKRVGDIVTKIEHTVDRWFPIIEKAFGWLIWFALHPFEEASSIWGTLTHFDPQGFIRGLGDALDREGQHIEDWIVHWLGE